MKNKKSVLFKSLISLLLCFSMLVGTTFAWFSDGVSSGTNMIAAGSLDIELDYLAADGTWQAVDASTEVLDKDALWEPGYTEVAYLRITNAGTLALKYALGIGILNETGSINAAGDAFKLSDYIEFGVVESTSEITYADCAAARNALSETKLICEGFSSEYSMNTKGDVRYVALVVYMPESVGNAANYATGKTPPKIELGIELVATQEVFESDSFGSDYDANADVPGFSFPENEFGDNASAGVTKDSENKVAQNVTIQGTNTNAVIPAGVQLEEDAEELTLEVTSMTQSEANITLGENDAMRSLNVHVEGVSADNTQPMEITIKEAASTGLNSGNLKLYHVENGVTVEMTAVETFTAHNQFKYDPATGDITLYMATFSEIALVADTENAWAGIVDTSWYVGASPYKIANADQLAGLGELVAKGTTFSGATVNLINDVNMGGEDYTVDGKLQFYPIGYTSAGYGGAFSGTFDGMGHKVSNIYQNTWMLVGTYDGTYYNAAMGLFGYVYNGTVKNLTIDNFNSEGEFAVTGCVTAYAAGNSTFENIAITNSHPQTYNTGVAGIVGWDNGGDSASEASSFTFKNITVDSSNTISALWGSWDVAAAGLLGYLGEYSTAELTNCNVAATIDVYNDVCGNYQYYWYRYCGMLIGTVDKTKDDGSLDLSNITATNCTVDFGDRHEYYYCEFYENSKASYTHDYQFSRVNNSDIVGNGENATCQNHDHEGQGYETIDGEKVLVEDKQAVYIPFRQIFGGYGWGVKGTELGENLADNIKDITKETEPDADGQVKFKSLFTGDFLYRVGNQNTVNVGSLFAAIDEEKYPINDAGVYVRIDKVYDDADVTCEFKANTTDWTQGTLQFTGTGVVDIVIQDYDYCTPTLLHLEVVDAQNTTSAMSATANSVVLLNDVSGSFSVYNGHTLYGNGFTVTLPTTSQSNYSSGYVGYVTMNDGNLDNVRIKGPDYPEMNIYREQAKDSSDATKANYFYNSLYINGGNCTINNSYISGSRTAICIRGGNNVTIDNTTVSGGAVANIEVAGASSVTLRDVTTVQTDANTVQGMGVYVTSGVCKIYIEGELTQRNWINQEKWKKLVGDYDNFFPDFFGDNQYAAYQKNINGVTYVNLAMIFACNWDKEYLDTSKQNNKADYTATDGIALQGYTGGVYSVTGNDPTADDLKEPDYQAGGFSPIIPTFNFDNSANHDVDDESDATDTYCVYDKDSGTLKVGVTGDSKAVDLSGISVVKNGVALAHTAYLNGTQISSDSVTVNVADGTKQILTFKATSDSGYDKDGNIITGEIEYTWTINVEIAVLAYPAPVWNMGSDYQFDTSNCYYAYYQTSQGYGEAVPIYEGVKVNYYNKSGTLVELDLSGTTTLPTGSNNANANAFTYTLSDGSTLTMKFSSGWKSGATTHQFTAYNSKAYLYPQSLDNDNYVRAKTTNQDFNVKLSYTFTDPNGQSTETVTMNWYNAAASNGSVSTVQWKTFDSTNGKEPECITPDTLITLADGSQVRADSLTGTEELLVWNMETGKLDFAPILFVDTDPEMAYEIIHLYFSDGTDVKVISEHGFWDYDLNKYVYLDRNAADYIGHTFAKQNGDKLEKVTLTSVVLETKVTSAWSPVTEGHLCYFVNGMLSMPGGVGGLFNIFEVDPETMTYNYAAMQRDIATYGLYTYEELNAICPLSEEMFNAAGGAYLKISIGKGNLTMDELIYMINRYSKFFK